MDEFKVIKNPVATEKNMRFLESDNKMLFEVNPKANKKEIKHAFEKLFKTKVRGVWTFTTTKGKKRAWIKISEETPALDVATELGMV